MKKIIFIFLLIISILVMNQSSIGDIKIGLVTDIGGIDDDSFNESAWLGLEEFKNDYDIKIQYLESNRESDYVTNLEFLANQEYDLLWGVGFLMEDSIRITSRNYPNTKFGIVDTSLGGNISSNVVGVTFKEHEGSFLVGLIAGLMTRADKIGFIGGIVSPLINKFRYGFMAGIHYVNPDAEVIVEWADSFSDSDTGRYLADRIYSDGADIIFHAAGNVGRGIFEVAKENDLWAIGVDSDQHNLAPDNILTSMMKNVNVAVYDISERYLNNDFPGGKVVEYGLKEGGVGISPTTSINTPQEVINKVEEIKTYILENDIEIPYDILSYGNFIQQDDTEENVFYPTPSNLDYIITDIYGSKRLNRVSVVDRDIIDQPIDVSNLNIKFVEYDNTYTDLVSYVTIFMSYSNNQWEVSNLFLGKTDLTMLDLNYFDTNLITDYFGVLKELSINLIHPYTINDNFLISDDILRNLDILIKFESISWAN